MGRRIIIDEDAPAQTGSVPAPAEPKNLDLQDWLLIGGICFSEGAAVVIWWPASLVLASVWCLLFAWLIERSKKPLVSTGANGAAKP
jgi:hypothetical protein